MRDKGDKRCCDDGSVFNSFRGRKVFDFVFRFLLRSLRKSSTPSGEPLWQLTPQVVSSKSANGRSPTCQLRIQSHVPRPTIDTRNSSMLGLRILSF
jgi:hypothetical protein